MDWTRSGDLSHKVCANWTIEEPSINPPTKKLAEIEKMKARKGICDNGIGGGVKKLADGGGIGVMEVESWNFNKMVECGRGASIVGFGENLESGATMESK